MKLSYDVLQFSIFLCVKSSVRLEVMHNKIMMLFVDDGPALTAIWLGHCALCSQSLANVKGLGFESNSRQMKEMTSVGGLTLQGPVGFFAELSCYLKSSICALLMIRKMTYLAKSIVMQKN